MKIDLKKEDSNLTIILEGRLDTNTAGELEAVGGELKNVTHLTLDLEKLDYVSSAGLRVLLSFQKAMNSKGEMELIHVNQNIMDIFEVTGFSDILNIK